ncbi:MAG: antitoxin Xre/MbcA/ParS toxin-binding domain-containing protein [Anaerolineales bacterium]
MTANTALRLARYFETSPEFWLGLQSQYDLDCEEDELSLTLKEVASALKIHPRTICRYKNHENVPSPDVRDRLAKLREISQLLDEVFSDQEAQLSWLNGSVPMLGGQRTIDRIRKGGLDEVISILAGIQSGAFA